MEKENTSANYLESMKKLFRYYKELGDKTFSQLDDKHINWRQDEESNSIAIVVKHLSGNMLSRWTDFLNSDGEKEWRNRENEFEGDVKNKKELMEIWEKGWDCLFSAIDPLTPNDLGKIVYIRNEGHTVMEAINRQLAHYPYHVGQIVFIGKMVLSGQWKSLSIPKGKSVDFNQQKFSEDKKRKNFI